ncbi:MAG: sigma-54 dependent transcriptional regulator [bacterium]
MIKLLVIDDESAIRRTLEPHLTSSGFQVRSTATLSEGEKIWRSFQPDIILLDIKLPDGDGLQFLADAQKKKLAGLVIVITGNTDMEHAIEAMRRGAYDYLQKPLDIDQLDALLVRARNSIQQKPEEVQTIEEQEEFVPGRITGHSQAVLNLHKQIGLAARSYANVLIRGESGVGKELVAKSIHRYSGYTGSFVAVNCSAIVATLAESELFGHEKGSFTGADSVKIGQLEFAKDGTIFLDEIGDLSLDLQVKLLRMLQEREFKRVGGTKTIPLEARVIAATHRDLEAMVKTGDFREDLYFRLQVLEIKAPPLRERVEDIPLLITALLNKINLETHRQVTKVPDQLIRQLQQYHWPGNVRELQNRLISAVIRSPGEVLEMPPPSAESEITQAVEAEWDRPLLEVEKAHIQRVLQRVDGHFGRACEILGISRPTLRKKISDYDLKVTFNDE